MKLIIVAVVFYLIGKTIGYAKGADKQIFYYGPNKEKYDNAVFSVLTRSKGCEVGSRRNEKETHQN